MINMLRSDMYKMFRAVSFRVLLVTAAIICVFSVIFINFSIKTTIELQEQKGVTVPKSAEILLALIPLNLPRIILLLSGGK